jgi:hypothetical protein
LQPRKVTAEVWETVKELRSAGLSQKVIGLRIGVSQSVVSKYLRANGPTPEEVLPDGNKRCRKCKVVKTVSEFWRHASAKDGLCGACKECMGAEHKANRASMRHWAKRHYGLTLEEYDALKSATPCCPICGSSGELHLDHDAVTGRVREFLCGKCNRGIGMFDHNIDFLEAAIKYLRRHG